jgi:cytochrome c-type biogenesis protein CcmE
MKIKLILAAVIVVSVAAWGFSSFTKSMTSYVDFAEAQKRASRVQVMGAVDHDKVVYDVDKQLLEFPITDEAGATMTVHYSGTMPGNFSQATHAVCVGRYNGSQFEAEQLLIKCPSKYQGNEG